MKEFVVKLKEAFFSIMPIFLIVTLLTVTVTPVSREMFVSFSFSSVLLVIGMALFNIGADASMIPMGSSIGSGLASSKKLKLMLICGLLIGFIITFAEPDLSVLAEQSGINKWLFIFVVSLGVGIFLLLAVLRIVFSIKLNLLLAISYGLVFILAFFVPHNFLPLCFDSGSVTTGPISVPFLIAFGLGLATIRSSKQSEDDSFGLIALSSAGPILAVMIVGLFMPKDFVPHASVYGVSPIGSTLLNNMLEVLLILLPIVVIFFIFQFTMLKLPKSKIVKICIGLFMTYIGIALFLTGVTAGYLPLAYKIGGELIASDYSWILYPLGFLLGYFVISAEPAVHVLKKQVEEITGGKLKQKTILIAISLGVSIAVFLATLKALFNIPILALLIPLYAITIGLSFVNPPVFSGIAFDAGGTATGAMAVSFILPFLSGVMAEGSAFGTVALIACMPILALQLLGLFYTIKVKKLEKETDGKRRRKTAIEVVDFEY